MSKTVGSDGPLPDDLVSVPALTNELAAPPQFEMSWSPSISRTLLLSHSAPVSTQIPPPVQSVVVAELSTSLRWLRPFPGAPLIVICAVEGTVSVPPPASVPAVQLKAEVMLMLPPPPIVPPARLSVLIVDESVRLVMLKLPKLSWIASAL